MHISDESFKNFYEKGTDKENILKHCAQCDYCAERLAEALPIQMSVQPMPYLNDMILKETAKYSYTRVLSGKFEFAFYCARVGIAMCFALLILTLGNFSGIKNASVFNDAYDYEINKNDNPAVSDKIKDTTEKLGGHLSSFCDYLSDNNIFDRNGKENNNEKTEK